MATREQLVTNGLEYYTQLSEQRRGEIEGYQELLGMK